MFYIGSAPQTVFLTFIPLAEYIFLDFYLFTLLNVQHFISSSSQFPALREFVGAGKPVWGTCAGLIFLANKAVGTWVTNRRCFSF